MVLNECSEGVIRFFFVLVKFMAVNWGWTITVLLALAVVIRLLSMVKEWAAPSIGFLAETADKITDFGVITAIGTVPSLIIGGVGVGLLWVGILSVSKANIVFKIIMIPFFFFGGFIIGMIPDVIPFSIGLGFLMKYKISANVFCGVFLLFGLMSIFLGVAANPLSYLLILLVGDNFCNYLNTISTYFV